MLFTVSPAKRGDFKRSPSRKGAEQAPTTDVSDMIEAALDQLEDDERRHPSFAELLEEDMTGSVAFDAMMIVSNEQTPPTEQLLSAGPKQISAQWVPPYSYSHLRDIEV